MKGGEAKVLEALTALPGPPTWLRLTRIVALVVSKPVPETVPWIIRSRVLSLPGEVSVVKDVVVKVAVPAAVVKVTVKAPAPTTPSASAKSKVRGERATGEPMATARGPEKKSLRLPR